MSTVRYYSLAPSSNNYIKTERDPSEDSIRSANSIGKRLSVQSRCNYLLKQQNITKSTIKSNTQHLYQIRTYFSPNKITEESVLQEIKQLQQSSKSRQQHYKNVDENSETVKITEQVQLLKGKQFYTQQKNSCKHKHRQSRLKVFMNRVHNRQSQNIKQQQIEQNLFHNQQQKKICQLFTNKQAETKKKHQKTISNKVSVLRYQSKQKIPKKLSPKKAKSQIQSLQNLNGDDDDYQLQETQKLIQFYSQELIKCQQTNTLLIQKITEQQQKTKFFQRSSQENLPANTQNINLTTQQK